MSIEHNELKLKHGTSNYGRFYPTGYVVAFFNDSADRQSAHGQLKGLNWADEDLIAVSGQELALLRQDIRDNRSLWGAFVAKFANKDQVLDRAEKGDYEALLVYAPDEPRRVQVRTTLGDLAVLAQSYDAMSFSQIPVSNGPPSGDNAAL